MPRAWWAAVGKLAILVSCVGFATSRIGLVVHEFVGHGGATLAVGGEVLDVRLYALAGGWIRYRLPEPGGELVIALGGIVVETAIGLALWAIARRDTLGARIVRALGAALIVHAAWYLATGTWHGYGDGTRIFRELGDDRWIVAVPAGLVACIAAFLGARTVLAAFADTLPEKRALGAAIAFVVATAIQLGAAVGEVRLRRDDTYANVMRREPDRVVARELAQWDRDNAAADAAARARKEAELAAKNRVFPFIYVLGALLVLSVIAGAWRGDRGKAPHLAPRFVARCAALAGGSIAVVIAIDALFH